MRKMDEMEKSNSLKAIKWSWLYMVVFLAVWSVMDRIKGGNMALPGFLFISQGLLYLVAQQLYAHRVGDENGRKILIAIGLAIVLLLTAGIVLLALSR